MSTAVKSLTWSGPNVDCRTDKPSERTLERFEMNGVCGRVFKCRNQIEAEVESEAFGDDEAMFYMRRGFGNVDQSSSWDNAYSWCSEIVRAMGAAVIAIRDNYNHA